MANTSSNDIRKQIDVIENTLDKLNTIFNEISDENKKSMILLAQIKSELREEEQKTESKMDIHADKYFEKNSDVRIQNIELTRYNILGEMRKFTKENKAFPSLDEVMKITNVNSEVILSLGGYTKLKNIVKRDLISNYDSDVEEEILYTNNHPQNPNQPKYPNQPKNPDQPSPYIQRSNSIKSDEKDELVKNIKDFVQKNKKFPSEIELLRKLGITNEKVNRAGGYNMLRSIAKQELINDSGQNTQLHPQLQPQLQSQSQHIQNKSITRDIIRVKLREYVMETYRFPKFKNLGSALGFDQNIITNTKEYSVLKDSIKAELSSKK